MSAINSEKHGVRGLYNPLVEGLATGRQVGGWSSCYLHPMPAYDTLSQAVDDLQRRGYTDDMQLGGHCLVCAVPVGRQGAKGLSLDPDEFRIDEFHRFEGNSDPQDQSIVYAISSEKHGVRGLLISAYGMDASALTQEMVRKLATHG